MSWIRKIFGLCEHRWVTTKEGDLVNLHPFTFNKVKIGEVRYQECSKCGDVRRKEIK